MGHGWVFSRSCVVPSPVTVFHRLFCASNTRLAMAFRSPLRLPTASSNVDILVLLNQFRPLCSYQTVEVIFQITTSWYAVGNNSTISLSFKNQWLLWCILEYSLSLFFVAAKSWSHYGLWAEKWSTLISRGDYAHQMSYARQSAEDTSIQINIGSDSALEPTCISASGNGAYNRTSKCVGNRFYGSSCSFVHQFGHSVLHFPISVIRSVLLYRASFNHQLVVRTCAMDMVKSVLIVFDRDHCYFQNIIIQVYLFRRGWFGEAGQDSDIFARL